MNVTESRYIHEIDSMIQQEKSVSGQTKQSTLPGGAAAYAALFISVFAHGQYFRLLQTYPVNTVVPLSLMTTVWACLLGVLLLQETLYARYLIGALLILPCVWVIARRGAPPTVVED